MAGAARRAAGGHRQLARAAGDGAPPAGEHDLQFPLHHGNAEATPFADAEFDLAISEYGAAIWCDPYRWIPEAARLLRPGGRLIFLGNATLMILHRPRRRERAGHANVLRPRVLRHASLRVAGRRPSVEFHLGHGDWIRLLRASGFEVEDLVEVQPPDGSTTRYPFVTLEWARRWPCEEVWKARKRAG